MQPVIYWIFGANGVGKTTNAQFLNRGVEHFNLDKEIMQLVEKDVPGFLNRLVNASEEQRPQLQENFLTYFENSAQEGNINLFNACSQKIKRKENFSLENNFLPGRNHEIVNRAIGEGYKLSIAYLAENDINKLLGRVETRTQLTGQYVPVNEIKRRYKGGKEDINELLNKPTKFPFKEAVQEILVSSAPSGTDLKTILYIENWRVKRYSKSLCKEFKEIIPNIGLWTGKDRNRGNNNNNMNGIIVLL